MSNDHDYYMQLLEDAFSTGTASFLTITRRITFLTDTAAQPVLFLRQIGSEYEWQGIMQVTTIIAEAWIGCSSSVDPQTPSSVLLNRLKCEVLDTMAPDDRNTGRFTLGGQVFWCRVEGHSDQYPGDVGQQSMAVLPIRITIP